VQLFNPEACGRPQRPGPRPLGYIETLWAFFFKAGLVLGTLKTPAAAHAGHDSSVQLAVCRVGAASGDSPTRRTAAQFSQLSDRTFQLSESVGLMSSSATVGSNNGPQVTELSPWHAPLATPWASNRDCDGAAGPKPLLSQSHPGLRLRDGVTSVIG
jgi:hypothetical protein